MYMKFLREQDMVKARTSSKMAALRCNAARGCYMV